MNLESIKSGMVVKSIAGHDSGEYFAVMYVKDGFAYIANGKQRKVGSPKKKNPLHLRRTNTVLDTADISDKKLRTSLAVLTVGADIAEESD